jgi:hypothetical protein
MSIAKFQRKNAEFQRKNAGKTQAKHKWKILLRSYMMRNLMGNPNLRSEFPKNVSKYTLRVANPWGLIDQPGHPV